MEYRYSILFKKVSGLVFVKIHAVLPIRVIAFRAWGVGDPAPRREN
jgi:hypothetical protein